jgi:hypothetical protein
MFAHTLTPQARQSLCSMLITTLTTTTFIYFLLVAQHRYNCTSSQGWRPRADSREGCGLRAHVSPKYLHTRVHRKVLALQMNSMAQVFQKPTVLPRNKFPAFSKPTLHYRAHRKTPTGPFTPSHPTTTLPKASSVQDLLVKYCTHCTSHFDRALRHGWPDFWTLWSALNT